VILEFYIFCGSNTLISIIDLSTFTPLVCEEVNLRKKARKNVYVLKESIFMLRDKW
jgi:hypothetical protein